MVERRQLIKRLMVSAILSAIACYAMFWAPVWVFILILEGFILLGLSEYFDIAEKKGYVLNRSLGLIFGALFPLAYYIPAESVIFMVATLCIFIFNFSRRLKDQALISTALTLFGLFYVAWFASFLAKIRLLPDGQAWVFYTLAVVKLGDTGAYFIGKSYGKHKYALHISPNKSVEGAVGGFVVSVAVSLASKLYLPYVPISHLLVLGIVVGILAQLGDLAESLIKREVNLKDSGHWPGLGGVLDVLDSLLFACPCVYYYIQLFQSGLFS
ncbi:MAG: phosphatidate cytidylyltransferase [Candidatus Omnitrophica bacterium]|nr:phosphatidate cytidylyltransferase [Candidatus Omnitrophota bacterium]